MPPNSDNLHDLINAPIPAAIIRPFGAGAFVFVCPYATAEMPEEFDNLGLTDAQSQSTIAWHAGTLACATHLSDALDSPVVHSTVSRLIYDCALPENVPEAIIAKQDAISIPGNAAVTKAQRSARSQQFYRPFRDLLNETIASRRLPPILVSIFSFEPDTYTLLTQPDLRICFGADDHLAVAVLQATRQETVLNITVDSSEKGAQNGTHILEQFGDLNGIRSLQIEIRSDHIANSALQQTTADLIARLLSTALENVEHGDQGLLR